jgi:folate-dependent phosphoribosylglycinamide formyltransferase PurN
MVHATHAGFLDADVRLLIYNNSRSKDGSKSGVVERLELLNRMYHSNIEGVHISNLTHPDSEGVEVPDGAITLAAAAAIAERTERFSARVMLGYMKRLRGEALELAWMNSHPGLLPATKGLWGEHVHQFVYDEGHEVTGHTLHWADSEYDTGPEINHREVPIMPFHDPKKIGESVQASERVWVPRFIHGYLHD